MNSKTGIAFAVIFIILAILTVYFPSFANPTTNTGTMRIVSIVFLMTLFTTLAASQGLLWWAEREEETQTSIDMEKR